MNINMPADEITESNQITYGVCNIKLLFFHFLHKTRIFDFTHRGIRAQFSFRFATGKAPVLPNVGVVELGVI